jgi:hypothetical protein
MNFDALLDQLGEFDLLLASGAAMEYRVAMQLRDHPDVLTIKLVSGKITFIHRPLWPAIYCIGVAREPWQMRGLSKDGVALLRQVDRDGKLLSSGDVVRELEARLLVHAQSVHTERGFHRKHVQTWKSWADSVQLGAVALAPAEGKVQVEAAVARLNRQFSARGTLPWQAGTKRR